MRAIFDILEGLLGDIKSQYSVAIVPTLMLLAWRIWRFTIQPLFRPDVPKELPYWIPFVGNALAVLRSMDGVVAEGQKYCGYTGEPFSVQVFGQTIYFVVSERDVSTVLNGPPELTHMDHVRDLLKLFGSSPRGLVDMYRPPLPQLLASSKALPNPKKKPMALLAEDLMNKQLLPSTQFDDLLLRMLEIVDLRTQWDGIPASAVLNQSSADGDQRTVSLLRWAQYTILESMTTAWFGAAIWDLSSTIISDMLCLDKGIWKLFFQLPRPWSRDVRAAQERLRRCMAQYLRLPPSRKEDRSWAARVAEDEMRLRAMGEEDMSSHLLMVFWGINANIFKVTFWLATYICSDSTVLRSFGAEVDDAISTTMSGSITALSIKLEKSAPVAALYNENLRLITNSSSERTVSRRCTINGKTYQPGARILLPYRQLAMAPRAFGLDSEVFRPDRFLLDGKLERSRSFIPFGDGKHKCPGRFITRRASLTFAALVVHRYQVGPMDAVPEMDLGKPLLGPVEPIHGRDMRLVIWRRRGGMECWEK